MEEIMTMAGISNTAKVLSAFIFFIGICAMATSFVTEGIKSIPSVDRLPTKLVVYVVSLVITPLVFAAMSAFIGIPIEWFMVFASFIASFVVAKVSMNGWEDVKELSERMLKM